MDDVRHLLQEAAARPEGPFDAEDVRRRVRRRHHRRVASAVAGVLVAAVVGVAGTVSLLGGLQQSDETEVELAPAPPEPRDLDEPRERDEPREFDEPRELDEPREPEEPGEPDEAPDPDAGTWSELPPAPIEGRAGAEAVWTGEEVIVWGGHPDAVGAAYDPAAEEWRELPEAPLAPREHHVAVWTGEELVVWGGTEATPPGASEEGRLLADGAAYDPESDEWRTISTGPMDARSRAAAAWTGEEVVIVGGTAPGIDPGTYDDRRDGGAYDPAADSWRPITDLPEDLAGATDAVWTGEEVVVPVGTHLNPTAAAAYDPESDDWREVEGAPAGPIPGSGHDLAWTGEEVAVVFGGSDPEEQAGQAAAYDPEADGWRELPGPPVSPGSEPQAVWGDRRLIVLSAGGGAGEASSLAIAYLDADEEEWAIEESPLSARYRRAVTWTGEALFVWGGAAGTDEEAEAHGDGAIWAPPETTQ